jgi:hypothetical protein
VGFEPTVSLTPRSISSQNFPPGDLLRCLGGVLHERVLHVCGASGAEILFFISKMAAQTTSTKMALKAVKIDADKRVIPKTASTKPRWWRVTLGKRVTGTGKIRRFFTTQGEANDFIADAVAASRQRGHFAFGIPHKLAIEAMEVARQLEPHGATLTDAAKFSSAIAGRLISGRSAS